MRAACDHNTTVKTLRKRLRAADLMPPPQWAPWPAERDAALAVLLATERTLTAEAIGARLGVARNAVVGKLHRLGYRKGAEGWRRAARMCS